MRRATYAAMLAVWTCQISIHALHEESDQTRQNQCHGRCISIHALHEESDCSEGFRSDNSAISIHALHEESDSTDYDALTQAQQFQSTLSMRRATWATSPVTPRTRTFQSTLSMRRATGCDRHGLPFQHISIHALHEESDGQSAACEHANHISIHALHEESDSFLHIFKNLPQHFNPRSP